MQLEFGGQRITVAAGELLIGSDPAAGLHLAGEGVAARHALVRQAASGALVLQPAAAGAVIRVNGSQIGGDPTPLFHGDRVGIGSNEVVVVDPTRVGATQVFAKAAESVIGRPEASRPVAVASGEASGRLVSLNDGREYHIAVVPFVMGRDATAQVVIGSPDASRHHAEIVSRPDGDVLVDLSANGTYVGGARISGRHQLRSLDVIRIGAEEFRYYAASKPARESFAPPQGAEFRLNDTLVGLPKIRPTADVPLPKVSAPRPLATMLVKSGSLKGERIPVKSAVVNIGRADYNDVRLPDPSVSSSHVKLQLREGVWTLSDLGSTNGTVVDGERVDDEVPLSPGAVLKLGDVSLLFDPLDERTQPAERTAVLSKAAAPVAAPIPPVADVVAAEKAANAQARPVPPARSGILIGLGIVVLAAALAALVFLL